MTSRISRVNELVKKELGVILLREIELPEEILFTITRVECFPNLQEARVYIMVTPEGKSKTVLSFLQKNIFRIQQFLNKKLKMRPVPKLSFLPEKGVREAIHMEELFEKIKKDL